MTSKEEPPAPSEQKAEATGPLRDNAKEESVSAEANDVRARAKQLLGGKRQLSPRKLHVAASRFMLAERFADAEVCLREAIRMREEGKKSEDLLCSLYLELGAVLRGQAKNEEAVRWLKKGYDLADSVPLSNFYSWQLAYQLLAAYQALGREADIKEWQERGLLLFRGFIEQKFGPPSRDEEQGEFN